MDQNVQTDLKSSPVGRQKECIKNFEGMPAWRWDVGWKIFMENRS